MARGKESMRADREAVVKKKKIQLTSLVKWRRVTATASVLKVLELIVARRRNRGERGDTEPTSRRAAGSNAPGVR